jgi:hypothetical protein
MPISQAPAAISQDFPTEYDLNHVFFGEDGVQ